MESFTVNGWFLLNNYILNPIPFSFFGLWDRVVAAPRSWKGSAGGGAGSRGSGAEVKTDVLSSWHL